MDGIRRTSRTVAFGGWIASVILAGLIAQSAWAVPPDIGANVDTFSLVDVRTNEIVSLTDFKDAKAIVLMFIAAKCPVSDDYKDRIVALHTAYKDKGVRFVAINSSAQESIDEVKSRAEKRGFKFPVLKDVDNKIADRLDARTTPEIYLLAVAKGDDMPRFILRYHGAIDDNQNPRKVRQQYLKTALDDLLAGKPIAKAETKAFGCAIQRLDRNNPAATP